MSLSSSVNWPLLRTAALEVRRKAYAPYSKFFVGAALYCAENELYCGVNVENVSFGLTICAERSAIMAAVSSGRQTFTALAVAADSDKITAPCGGCLQVLAEFVRADFPVLLINARNGSELSTTLGKLLPFANHGLENLGKNINTL